MKIRTNNELKEFEAALDKCTSEVWLMGPNDEAYNMKNEEECMNGIFRLADKDADQFGIYTTSDHDEVIMLPICLKLAA